MADRTTIICVVAATLALATVPGATAFATPEDNRCITPAGTDAHEVLGVAEQLVVFEAPQESGCATVSTGERWIPSTSSSPRAGGRSPIRSRQYLAKLPPLPPGQHTWSAVLQMSALSCDGLGSEGGNCIGPGTITLCTRIPFTVEHRRAAIRVGVGHEDVG